MKIQPSIPFLIYTVSLFFSGQTAAQLYYKAGLLTVNDGLSSNRVNCFYKDSTGFMWIGTDNGLNRYDGHSFRVFRPTDSNSISNEIINTIDQDGNGTIWVGTMDGLNYYEPSPQNWHSLRPGPDSNATNDLPNNIIWDIHIDDEGLVWIASDVFEFSCFDPVKKKFTYYDWPTFAAGLPALKNIHYKSIQKILPKSEHEFWLATTIGLVSVNTRTKEFRFRGGGYSGSVIDLAYDTLNKKVFLSATNDNLFVYDEKEDSFKKLHPKNEAYPSTEFSFPEPGEHWLGADKGLIKIDAAGKKIYLSDHIPQLSASLLPGGVRAVFRDNTNLKWVATANGVAIYDLAGSSSFFLPLLPTPATAGSNNMGGIYFDEVSNSYFVCAADQALVYIINSSTGDVQSIRTDSDGITFSTCNSIKADNNGTIWLLTDSHVYTFERISNRFVRFPIPEAGSGAGFRAFAQDENGDYWFGSFRKGLYYYRCKEQKIFPLPDSLLIEAKNIYCLTSDTINHCIWISVFGTHVYKYEPVSGKLTCIQETSGFLQMDLAHDILTDKKGNTWVATDAGGLFKYHPGLPEKQAFERFNITTGLPSNNFVSLCEDENSNIWLLSGNGISVIDNTGKFLKDVNKMQSLTFSAYSSDTRSQHNLLFNKVRNEIAVAVAGGLLIYSPGRSRSTVKFPLVLTNIRIGAKNIEVTNEMMNEDYQIPYRSNSVSFRFAGLFYGIANDIVYEYRLEGYDENWVRMDKSFEASYQNLPPGNYRFHARARNINGIPAGEVTGFRFNIVPPFWQTWWFAAIVTLLFGGTIFWLIYSLILKLKEEKVLNSFATSLYGQNTIEDILWDIAKNCASKLGFTDCVIYQYEADKKLLVQKAAYGPKNSGQRVIFNAIDIPLGKGIVGSIARSGKAEIIGNTARDSRYIVDDEIRNSEIAVPVFVDGKIFGVIDSEHPEKNFYKRYHLRILRKVAAVSAVRIAKYISEEQLRGKIARDLHDEMGSTLTSINIMCKVAMEGGGKDIPVSHYLRKIKENSGRMLESISDMVWVINPANDNFEKLMFRMKEFSAEILEPARINYQFLQEGALQNVQLNVEQRKEIYMIFKEALTNVVKYSEASGIVVTLTEKNNILRVKIADNGIGFDVSESSSGNGISNMKARAKQIGAQIAVDSTPGKGCSISLELGIS